MGDRDETIGEMIDRVIREIAREWVMTGFEVER